MFLKITVMDIANAPGEKIYPGELSKATQFNQKKVKILTTLVRQL